MQVSAGLLPTLVHVQAHLHGDLSLERLASFAGTSPSTFHRRFKAETGETPKRYTQRLRLERAALRLCLHQTTVLETALEVGFRSHETFTRAFRRHFGVAPSHVARSGLAALSAGDALTPRRPVEPQGYELSESKLVKVKPMHLAFIRHTGPYEKVPESIWHRLKGWANEIVLPRRRILLGLGLDAPSVTPADKLRFDAALRLEEPLEVCAPVGYQLFPGGLFFTTTHVGHYSTLVSAYRTVVARLEQRNDVRFAGLPALEVYHETAINMDSNLNHTDLYLPVASATDRAGFEIG